MELDLQSYPGILANLLSNPEYESSSFYQWKAWANELQKDIGHASYSTNEIYARIVDSKLKQDIDLFNDL